MIVSKINVKNLREKGYENLVEWLNEPGHIYVGRACHYVKGADRSVWMNPFSIKKYGIDKSLELYENHIRTNLWDKMDSLKEYSNLGCWCIDSHSMNDSEICHAQVLRRLYHEYTNS